MTDPTPDQQTHRPTRLCIIVTVPTTLATLYRGQFEYLQSHGYDITAIASTGDAHQRVRDRGIKTIAIPMQREPSPLKDLVSLFRLTGFLLFNRFDIVHVSTPKAGLLGSIAARLSFHHRVLYTLRGRAYENFTGRKRKLFDALERVVCRLSRRVFPIANELAQAVIDENICPEKKVHVVGNGSSNGIDLNQYQRSDAVLAQGKAIRDELGLKESDLLILAIGRIRREKGINELARAFDQLAQQHDHIHLLLVGMREPVDPLEDEVERIITTHPRIHTLDWQNDPTRSYAAADIVAFPTYREGFGNVTLESGAMRLPVVASDVKGPREVVEDGVNGYLVPVQTVDPLRDRLNELIQDPDLRDRLGSAGHEIVTNRYAQPVVWADLLAEYKKAMENQQ